MRGAATTWCLVLLSSMPESLSDPPPFSFAGSHLPMPAHNKAEVRRAMLEADRAVVSHTQALAGSAAVRRGVYHAAPRNLTLSGF